jgi:uncharacterized membrane protein HdeD (DUF308 family)
MSIIVSFKKENVMAKALTSKDVHGVLVAQGVITLLFGVAVVFWPSLTLAILVYLAGAYILVSGIAHIFHGLSTTSTNKWWALTALLGVTELGFGVYILRHPAESFSVFISLIGFILIIRGVIELVSALFDPQSSDTNRGLSVFTGLFAIVVGIVVLDQKAAAGIAFVWLLGIYAITVGIIELMVARSVELDK